MNGYVETLAVPTASQYGAVTVGNFDGVHTGHRSLLQTLRALADSTDGPSVVITFDPPPSRLLRPMQSPQPLSTVDWKRELLMQAGVDQVVVLPTTMDLLRLEAKEFFDFVICRLFQAKAMVEGENFRFGKDRLGDVELLRSLCQLRGMHFQLAEVAKSDGDWVSSTRVRQLIERGDLAEANRFLLRPYRFIGRVGQGAQRGRTLGFPTANLESIPVLVPANGVYAARVVSVNGDARGFFTDVEGKPVALHIGPNPTFGEDAKKVEAHILDFTGDLYGSTLQLELIDKVRDIQKFESKETLLRQLNRDIEGVRAIVNHARIALQ